ncbi:MAG: ASKHA domain-containing protein [Fimbriimonadaceae bacterium]|nr:ASKHA domain-containing protein [Fimbriimonadaceae bacterium]
MEDGLIVHVPASSVLSRSPQVESGFRIGVPLALDPLFPAPAVGIAVDVGTSTVAVLAVDLATGRTVGKAADFNRQMELGDDVLTRISQCLVDPQMVGRMQQTLVSRTLEPLIRQALPEGSTPAGIVLAGNTTMLHLALGIDPSGMGAVPFRPEFLEAREVRAEDLGLPWSCPVVALPGASAYVGADVVAGLVSTGFAYGSGARLFVDVGTNGEMVAGGGLELIGCATAAGPAFEGSGLSSGVRAGEGAISAIRMHRSSTEELQIDLDVIGGQAAGRPIGLCGSAYIDFLAEARRVGLLTSAGRFAADVAQVRPSAYGRECVVALGLGKREIVVSEPDVAALLQAKAAIAAGIQTLLNRVGALPSDIETLTLAGGFGMHLNRQNAIDCGLLPGFRPEQIDPVGNSSLGGAYLALVDRSSAAEMQSAADRLEVIELNQDPDFEDAFIDCLALD